MLYSVSNVTATIPADQNYDKVTVSKGGGILLKCTVASESLGCAFISPDGNNYNMLRDAAYDQGRIQQEELNFNDCAMKITDIREIDSGIWECSVTVKDANENFDIGVGHIEVIVAIPPDKAYMTFENHTNLQNITINHIF